MSSVTFVDAERVQFGEKVLLTMEPDLISNSHQADIDVEEFGSRFIRLKTTDQIKELQTILRDRQVSSS